jgi:putative spermidine/putrescine transport system permease protein
VRRAAALLAGPVTAAAVFFFAPLALMGYRSLTTTGGAWSLVHYTRFAADAYYIGGLFITLGTALLVTLMALACSYPVALTYWRASGRLKSVLIVLLLSPFYANVAVKVLGWMIVLPGDWLNGYAGLVIVSVHRAMPFMVLLLAGAMSRIEPEWVESARTCGASGGRLLRTIIWPLSVPGAVAGGVLVFSMTVAAYVVPAIVGGAWRGRFLPVLMYQQMTISQDWGFGAAIGMILLIAAVMTIAIGNSLVRISRAGTMMREGFDD